MKYVRMLGLLALAAAALMAFVGTASATELTSPKGVKLKNGTEIKAHAGETTLHGSVTITCQTSTVHGKITKEGSLTETVEGEITTLDFENCGNDTVSVIKPGKLIVHTRNETADNTGTVTSTGAEVTVTVHRTVLGFPVTTHCIYTTNETHIGILIGSEHTDTNGVKNTTATLDIGSSAIPQSPTDGACGSTATWTGTYTITSPDHLYVD